MSQTDKELIHYDSVHTLGEVCEGGLQLGASAQKWKIASVAGCAAAAARRSRRTCAEFETAEFETAEFPNAKWASLELAFLQ